MPSMLPPPRPDQCYVTVSPIPGGFITLADRYFVHPANADASRTVPSLTFLITHPKIEAFGSDGTEPFRMMFDLGLRKSADRYPCALRRHIINNRAPHRLEPGVAAQLRRGGLLAEDIDLVVLSHVHYDHHGDPEDFPNAQFRVGYGGLAVLKDGLPQVASHQHFEPNTLPFDRSAELSDPQSQDWHPIGTFPAALDLFNDGSVYVIDSPGHLPGHCNLLCRMKERWVLLCGDSFHDGRLLSGEKAIGTWKGDSGETLCIHLDKERAQETIMQLREFDRKTGAECELIAAHDDPWWEEHKTRMFPTIL